MNKIEYVSIADWNAATDKAMTPGYSVADDPRCLYGWGPSPDKAGPKGCHDMFGHYCDRPFRHPGECKENTDYRPYPCKSVMRPDDWDDKVRTECNS